jgi:TRAP-type C4-dicarboxylate transport system permease small subunit
MSYVYAVLAKIDHGIELLQKALIVLGVLAMVVINGAQVFCRFVVHASIPWSEQISLLLFLVLIMLGGNFAIRTDTETRIEILHFRNENINKVIRIIVDIICIITLVIFLISSVALETKTMRLPQYLSSVQLSYVYIYIWLVIGFALMIFDKVINIIKCILYLQGADVNRREGEEQE